MNGSEDDFHEMGRHAEDLLGSVVPFIAAVCGTDDTTKRRKMTSED